jgi:ABC-type sugar transport system permease subunit
MENNILIKSRKPIRGYVYIVGLSAAFFFLMISIWPGIYALYLTFFNTDILSYKEFIGFDNYISIFTSPLLKQIFTNNLYYVLVYNFGGLIISLIIAALINSIGKSWAKKLFVALYFAPGITGIAAVAVIWKIFYYPKFGIFSTMISNIFNIATPNILGNAKTALLGLMIMDIWMSLGFRILILNTAMDEIPESIVDAARIDGSYGLHYFFRITIPLIMRQIIFLIAIGTISAINVFASIFVLTSPYYGGPGNATTTLAIQLYTEAWRSFKFGRGSVYGIIILVILIGFIYLNNRLFREEKIDI